MKMTRAEIEIAVLQEAIKNLEVLYQENTKIIFSYYTDEIKYTLLRQGIQLAIDELQNMIDETQTEND